MAPKERKEALSRDESSLDDVGVELMSDNADPELLFPPYDSPERKTSLFSATFNLVATIIGGGVLSLPMAFSKAGIGLATLLMIFSAIITDFSLYILCSCARRTNSNSYMQIVHSAFGPRAEKFVTWLLVFLLLGVLIGYCDLLKGIFAPLVQDFIMIMKGGGEDQGLVITKKFESVVLFFILLLVAPLMVQRNLYALRHICYVGFTSVCVIAVSISYRAYQKNFTSLDNGDFESTSKDIKYFTNDWKDAAFAFPVITLAFLCSFNMVEVHGALEQPSRKRVRFVIHTAVISCFLLFEIFGLAGYFYAYDFCQGNIFLNFDPSDRLIIIGRLGMGLTLVFATPIVLLPCREAILSLVTKGECDSTSVVKSCEMQLESNDILDEEKILLRNDEVEPYFSVVDESLEEDGEIESEIENINDDNTVLYSSSFSIASLAYIGAVAVPGVETVWSVIGSSLGISIAFIIPSLCYLTIRRKKGMKRSSSLWSLFLLLFSIFAAIVCTIMAVWSA